MADFDKRLEKVASGVLTVHEHVQAWTRCVLADEGRRRGHSKALTSALAALSARREERGGTDALGHDFPDHLVLALTDRRVLVLAASAMTGAPTRVLHSVAIHELLAVSTNEIRVETRRVVRFSLWFADGSGLTFEASGTGARLARNFCVAVGEARSTISQAALSHRRELVGTASW